MKNKRFVTPSKGKRMTVARTAFLKCALSALVVALFSAWAVLLPPRCAFVATMRTILMRKSRLAVSAMIIGTLIMRRNG